VGEGFDEVRYVDALLEDLEGETALTGGRDVISVFVGGGTPSLMSGDAVARLLDGARQRVRLSSDAEITLEANPGAVDGSHFAGYRDAGVNRISIGAQSFDDARLRALGRIHSAAEIERAVDAAHAAGFSEINLDLMFALPGQTTAEAIRDLEQAVALRPTHVSWYQLTIEPNTSFHHSPPPDLPDDERISAIHDAGRTLLEAAGYPQYEISAYAPAASHCRHNRNYWEFGDYMGIGAGAHGKITRADGRVERRRKHRHPTEYMERAEAGDALSGATLLQDEDLILEIMMNALRLNDGVPAHWFTERTGLNLPGLTPRIRMLEQRGLMMPCDERIEATETGRRYLNELLMAFA
jgi:oxygen-independent coproporphyrinogen-3 oxidase